VIIGTTNEINTRLYGKAGGGEDLERGEIPKVVRWGKGHLLTSYIRGRGKETSDKSGYGLVVLVIEDQRTGSKRKASTTESRENFKKKNGEPTLGREGCISSGGLFHGR